MRTENSLVTLFSVDVLGVEPRSYQITSYA
nr:MAG TPA: hypothetical protein [Caudoviricetes sp.]